MKNLFLLFVTDKSGVTAIEYSVIAGLIALVIIAAVTTVGTNLHGMFNFVANSVSGATGSGA
jgi:pilus assembly protein Flp/PilA